MRAKLSGVGSFTFGLLAAIGCGPPNDSTGDPGQVTGIASAIENGTPVAADDRGACLLTSGAGSCTAILLTNSWAFSANHCLSGTETSLTLKCPAEGNLPITITDIPNNVFKRPANDVILMHLPRRVNMLGGTYTVNNLFFQFPDWQLVDTSVYCLGFGNGTLTLTSGQFTVSSVSSVAVTTVRNSLDQLPTYGDSGGTCFLDTTISPVRVSSMIGVTSGLDAPGPDGKSKHANYGNATNYRDWVDATLFNQPTSIGTSATSSPAIVATGQDKMTAFVRHSDNAIYARSYSNGVWTGSFTSIGGVATSDPAAASYAPGKFAVFIRSQANDIQYRDFNGTSYGPWTGIGGSASSDPAVVSDAGRLYVFITSSGAVKYKVRDTAGAWSAWGTLPTSTVGTPGPELTAVRVAADYLSILVRMTNGTIGHTVLINGSFGTWGSLSGTFSHGPAATSSGPKRIDLFAVNQDGTLAYMKRAVGWSQNWINLGGVVGDSVEATSRGTGSIDIVYKGSGGSVQHRRFAP